MIPPVHHRALCPIPETIHDPVVLRHKTQEGVRCSRRLCDVPVLIPENLAELREAACSHDPVLLAGGTDLMVALNHRSQRIESDSTVVSLARVPELRSWSHDPTSGELTIGSGITWSQLERAPFDALAPALAQAARTVGSPQIRNAGTIGGNIATASPAGDGLPVLLALDATVDSVGSDGERSTPLSELLTGTKRTSLAAGEVIVAVRFKVDDGWQGYAKIGVRNAMVISVAGVALVLDGTARRARIALGSVGPTVLLAGEASAFLTSEFDWDSWTCSEATIATVAEMAAEESRPIDDHRSTAEYRRHGVRVLTSRLLKRGRERR